MLFTQCFMLHIIVSIHVNDRSTTVHTRVSFDPRLIRVATVSKMCANSLFERSFMYATHTLWNTIDLDYCLVRLKKYQDTSFSEVFCKLILIIYLFTVAHEENPNTIVTLM